MTLIYFFSVIYNIPLVVKSPLWKLFCILISKFSFWIELNTVRLTYKAAFERTIQMQLLHHSLDYKGTVQYFDVEDLPRQNIARKTVLKQEPNAEEYNSLLAKH